MSDKGKINNIYDQSVPIRNLFNLLQYTISA